MIGTASFVSVFRIGSFVKFPSIFIPHPFLFFIIHKSYYTWFNKDFHQELSIYIKNPFEEILFSKRAFCLNLFIIFLRKIQWLFCTNKKNLFEFWKNLLFHSWDFHHLPASSPDLFHFLRKILQQSPDNPLWHVHLRQQNYESVQISGHKKYLLNNRYTEMFELQYKKDLASFNIVSA